MKNSGDPCDRRFIKTFEIRKARLKGETKFASKAAKRYLLSHDLFDNQEPSIQISDLNSLDY